MAATVFKMTDPEHDLRLSVLLDHLHSSKREEEEEESRFDQCFESSRSSRIWCPNFDIDNSDYMVIINHP